MADKIFGAAFLFPNFGLYIHHLFQGWTKILEPKHLPVSPSPVYMVDHFFLAFLCCQVM
jgi:hypothetical protein